MLKKYLLSDHSGRTRIDLRRADATVSQHLRERFDRYVVRQADRRGVGVAAAVVKNFFTDNYPEPIMDHGIPCVDMTYLYWQIR